MFYKKDNFIILCKVNNKKLKIIKSNQIGCEDTFFHELNIIDMLM